MSTFRQPIPAAQIIILLQHKIMLVNIENEKSHLTFAVRWDKEFPSRIYALQRFLLMDEG
jgi:hypothetical protein